MANPSCSSSICSDGSIAFTACATPRCVTSTWPVRLRTKRRRPRRSPRAGVAPDPAGARCRSGTPQIHQNLWRRLPTPDGTCIRDYIHVSDLADAHLLALDALEKHEKLILNLGNGKGFSVRQSSSRPAASQPPIPAKSAPAPATPLLIASSEKAIQELGWKPKYTQLDEIVRTACSGTRNATPDPPHRVADEPRSRLSITLQNQSQQIIVTRVATLDLPQNHKRACRAISPEGKVQIICLWVRALLPLSECIGDLRKARINLPQRRLPVQIFSSGSKSQRASTAMEKLRERGVLVRSKASFGVSRSSRCILLI